MTKKFIAFDIDGTLLTTKKEFLESTKEALATLKANGHQIAIATGRNHGSTKAIFEELEIDTYILCNGSQAYVRNELMHEVTHSKESLQKLIDVASVNQHQILFLTKDHFKRHFDEPREFNIFPTSEGAVWKMPEFDNTYWENNPIIQAMLLCKEEDLPKYDGIEEFRYVKVNELGSDVIPKDGSKANTILKVAKKEGFDSKDVIFFGDGMNDLELIEAAGIGVAMGNAVEEVKKKADLITDSCDADGIYNALKKLELI